MGVTGYPVRKRPSDLPMSHPTGPYGTANRQPHPEQTKSSVHDGALVSSLLCVTTSGCASADVRVPVDSSWWTTPIDPCVSVFILAGWHLGLS